MNSRGTPASILSGHAPNKLTDFCCDRPTPAPPSARFPGPMKAKAFAVSTHQGAGLEDMKCLETAGPNAVQPDPEQALAPTETVPFVVSLSNHGKLLAKREDFQVEQRAASEDDRRGRARGKVRAGCRSWTTTRECVYCSRHCKILYRCAAHPPTTELMAKIGRNAPCPCGSSMSMRRARRIWPRLRGAPRRGHSLNRGEKPA